MGCLGFPISPYSLDFHCLIGCSLYLCVWLWKIGRRVQVIEVHIKCKRNQKIANYGGISGGGALRMVEYWPDSDD